ncbi:MAG: class 1 fructose-bisphosphatase [Rhodospirillaceae bacterium]
MGSKHLTLAHFLYEDAKNEPKATGELASLINDIAAACKAISNLVNHGDLAGDLGGAVGQNVQDETQKELDVLANETFLVWTRRGGQLTALASEEMEEPYIIPESEPRGKYLLVFDPLDGSSNIEINGPVGTIFSLLRSPDPSRLARAEDFLQPGSAQIAAGYVLYSASTTLVLTLENKGVSRFTLDPGVGEFVLVERDIKIPPQAKEFAINASNSRFWEAPVTRYISECLSGKTGPRGKDFNMRWVAAMVADVHRCISRGGVFMYPIDEKCRDKGGRLRLLYEASPMSMIIEHAGGRASTGLKRILDVKPENIHQRIPVMMGSKEEVEVLERYHQDAR